MERNDSNPRLTKMGVFLFLVFPHFCERQEKKIGCHLLMGREKKQFSHKYDSIKEEEKMNASVAIQVLPNMENDEELIRVVDEVIDYIKSTGYNYYVGPFETTIEGDYDALMDIVKECQHIAIRAGAPSVAAYIKVSYKPEGDILTIEKKVTKHHQ
jgi:uncharacterized protein YqgV (UPF0045/DUF77 family)